MLYHLIVILWIFPLNAMLKDVVRLSNSGPVIKGSEIVFKAEVVDRTSHPVQDDKHFEYRWKNTVDFLTATTKGYKNTTHRDCYEWVNTAKEYKMTVRVCDLGDNNKCHYIGSAETYFEITEDLNGNLNINQSLNYRNPNTSAVFSTHKPLQLHLNLTDKFKAKPTMAYTWSIDGGTPEVTNTPENDLPIPDTGEHEIYVRARATDGVLNCDDYHTGDVQGQFVERVILKDPVVANMSGATAISTKDPLVINITLNGSEPFTVCWSSDQSVGLECINDWCCEELTNETQCNITVPSLAVGSYSFNISVANDISRLYRQHNITVSVPPPTPSNHSAADVLLPVIGALFAVTLLLAAAIYISKVRKKKHVEVADFNFHPHISSTERHRDSFVTNIKYTFQRMFDRNNYERLQRHGSCAPVPSQSYGSLEETSAKESIFETL